MWVDDCVHFEVAKAMILQEMMNEEELKELQKGVGS